MSPPGGAPATEPGATVSATIATPPEWRVLDLGRLEDARWARSRVSSPPAAEPEGDDGPAAELADLAAGATGSDVIFAATCDPGEGASIDLSTITLALRPAASDPGKGPESQPSAAHDRDPSEEPAQMVTGPGPSQNAVELPAGAAARLESFEVMEIGAPVNALPVFCVEYALPVPNDDRVLVLTFATIAPSSTAALRAQFAEIASTLAFAPLT